MRPTFINEKDEYKYQTSNELHILFPFRELMARDPNTGASNSSHHILENGSA